MLHCNDFLQAIGKGRLAPHAEAFRAALDERGQEAAHGDLADWQRSLDLLPMVSPSRCVLDTAAVQIGLPEDLDDVQRQSLVQGLQGLHPWRKGPLGFFGTEIDTEWRSDWKWDRLMPHISPLRGRHVLDVGCGSGYHCWRMLGAGADFVLGVDPSVKYLYQFQAVKRYLPRANAFYLPLRSEDLPAGLACFDTVFSMGVIYHRKSPFEHLEELRSALVPGGELVLETLVVPGDERTVLTPPDRYAQMRNVWFIPSVATALLWLRKAGLTHERVVDITVTTPAEQRRTEWMTFLSLSDFLEPDAPDRTLEGHPAPTRAIFIARRPP